MEAVKPLVVVCGDGIYLTVYDRDDGNKWLPLLGELYGGKRLRVHETRIWTSVCTLPQKHDPVQCTSSRVVREGNSTSAL